MPIPESNREQKSLATNLNPTNCIGLYHSIQSTIAKTYAGINALCLQRFDQLPHCFCVNQYFVAITTFEYCTCNYISTRCKIFDMFWFKYKLSTPLRCGSPMVFSLLCLNANTKWIFWKLRTGAAGIKTSFLYDFHFCHNNITIHCWITSYPQQ